MEGTGTFHSRADSISHSKWAPLGWGENIFLRKHLHSSCSCWDVGNAVAKGSVSSLGHALHGCFIVCFVLFFKEKHPKYLSSPPPASLSASPGSPLSLETMARHSPKPRCSPFSAPPCLTGKFSADDVKTTAFRIVFCTLSGEGLGGFFCEICVFHNVFIFACCGWAKTGAEYPNCSVLSRLGWQFPSLSRVISAHGAAERAVTPKASPSAHQPTLSPNSRSSSGFFLGNNAPGAVPFSSCSVKSASLIPAEELGWVNHSPGSPCPTQPCPSRLLIAKR